MELIRIFAAIGIMFNDLFALFSVIGSFILLVGALVSKSPMRKFGRVANWSVMGLVFGVFFQICMTITDTTPDLIGMVVRMTPLVVNSLLAMSFLFLAGRWWMKRNR